MNRVGCGPGQAVACLVKHNANGKKRHLEPLCGVGDAGTLHVHRTCLALLMNGPFRSRRVEHVVGRIKRRFCFGVERGQVCCNAACQSVSGKALFGIRRDDAAGHHDGATAQVPGARPPQNPIETNPASEGCMRLASSAAMNPAARPMPDCTATMLLASPPRHLRTTACSCASAVTRHTGPAVAEDVLAVIMVKAHARSARLRQPEISLRLDVRRRRVRQRPHMPH
jgi:hypothetical protein